MSNNSNNIHENDENNGQKSRFDFLSDQPNDDDVKEASFGNIEEDLANNTGDKTLNFEPVSKKLETDGSTRLFDTVDDAKSRKPENVKKGKSKKGTMTSRAAKKTARTVLFLLGKLGTYLLSIFLTILVVGLITGSVVVLAFAWYIDQNVDPEYTGLDNLKYDSSLSTTMYYLDDKGNEVLLEDDTLESSENRLWAPYDEIPQDLINAYIAVEDQRFMEHNGVDFTRTASAIYNFFVPTSSNYGGGSTITQQLIKNVTGENEATIQRKVQEIFRAFNVDEKFTKKEILEMYLNTIYLSHNAYGVRVAAETYFAKDLSELNLAECAAIASIGKWPTHYDPISNPQNNLTRRNLVLKLMLEQGMISEEEFNEFYDAPITLATGDEEEKSYSENVHSYYIDAVMDDVIADLMKEYGYDKATASRVLFSGGLEIVTCLDPAIQNCAEKIFESSNYWPKTTGIQGQAAMCIMDPDSGDLLAIVGGLGEKRESRGLNRATHSYRQCGSSIKPISIYAPALENGIINPASGVDDVPPVYKEETQSYWPRNAGGSYRGLVSLDFAIRNSLNTVPVALCEKMGVDSVYDNLLSYGYTTLADHEVRDDGTVLTDRGSAALALGGLTYGVTVRDHTQAYATLANSGTTSKARTYSVVRDSTGKVILDNEEKHEVKYQESTIAALTELMRHVVEPGGTAGTAITVDNKYNLAIAGKTGTTSDKKDVYFSGYTPDLVACCWYGFDNNKAITSDGSPAATLWNAVFDEIYKYYNDNGIEYKRTFEIPSSMVKTEICAVSGKLAIEGVCNRDAFAGNCITSLVMSLYDAPMEFCDIHVEVPTCEETGALYFKGHNTCKKGDTIVLRKLSLSDRSLHGNIIIRDAGYIYMDIPDGYVFPTESTVPFFQNALPEDISFGKAPEEKPANRVCIDHVKTEEPEDPEDPDDPENPDDPNPDDPNPDDPADEPADVDIDTIINDTLNDVLNGR